MNGCCLLFDQHLFTFSSRQTVFAVMPGDHGPCEESGGPCEDERLLGCSNLHELVQIYSSSSVVTFQ